MLSVKKMKNAKCAKCESDDCYFGKDCFDMAGECLGLYTDEDRRSMSASAEIEAGHYMEYTRIEEVMSYAEKRGFSRLGIAFCIGLKKEVSILNKILEKRGFEVFSVCCKACGIPKSEMELMRLHPEMERESICNPVGQAEILSRNNTDLNIIVGLCVGHDILFTKYSEAPVTTLIVKDRVLAHNPVGALSSSYYRKSRFGLEG